jgi:hypothetical protein
MHFQISHPPIAYKWRLSLRKPFNFENSEIIFKSVKGSFWIYSVIYPPNVQNYILIFFILSYVKNDKIWQIYNSVLSTVHYSLSSHLHFCHFHVARIHTNLYLDRNNFIIHLTTVKLFLNFLEFKIFFLRILK